MNTARIQALNEYIQERGEVKLAELFAFFPQVSSMTIRRDLEFMEKQGLIRRMRGSVRAGSDISVFKEAIYSQRAQENTEAKLSIAKKALDFMRRGCSVFIDAGSTTMAFARLLPEGNYFILTNAPNMALELITKPNAPVMLTGGTLNHDNLTLSGAKAVDFVSSINVDIAFMATSGYSLSGQFTSGNFDEAELKKLVIKKAHTVVMLMDGSKLDRNMPFTFATMSDIDVLISEGELPEEVQAEAQRCQTKIV